MATTSEVASIAKKRIAASNLLIISDIIQTVQDYRKKKILSVQIKKYPLPLPPPPRIIKKVFSKVDNLRTRVQTSKVSQKKIWNI